MDNAANDGLRLVHYFSFLHGEEPGLKDMLRTFYRTLGEDRGITGELVADELRRALAVGICSPAHYPRPCLACIKTIEPLVKPLARTLLHVGRYERRYDIHVGYAAFGSGIEFFIQEMTGVNPFCRPADSADETNG